MSSSSLNRAVATSCGRECAGRERKCATSLRKTHPAEARIDRPPGSPDSCRVLSGGREVDSLCLSVDARVVLRAHPPRSS